MVFTGELTCKKRVKNQWAAQQQMIAYKLAQKSINNHVVSHSSSWTAFVKPLIKALAR